MVSDHADMSQIRVTVVHAGTSGAPFGLVRTTASNPTTPTVDIQPPHNAYNDPSFLVMMSLAHTHMSHSSKVTSGSVRGKITCIWHSHVFV